MPSRLRKSLRLRARKLPPTLVADLFGAACLALILTGLGLALAQSLAP